MQALMLAAGMGKRLGRYTKNATKCMVPVNGKTLIEYAIEAHVKNNNHNKTNIHYINLIDHDLQCHESA